MDAAQELIVIDMCFAGFHLPSPCGNGYGALFRIRPGPGEEEDRDGLSLTNYSLWSSPEIVAPANSRE